MLVSKAIENKAKEKKAGFLGTLLATLGPSLLGNMLAGERGFQSCRKNN